MASTPRLEMTVHSRMRIGAVVLICMSLVAAGPSHATKERPGGTQSSLHVFEHTIVMRGSTTVEPIARAFAERCMVENPEVCVQVTATGSGDGAKALINKQCDIACMSRFMSEREFTASVENGVHPVFHVVAIDAVAVVVHPDNPIDVSNREQLRKIFSGAITNWKEVGGPDQNIVVIGRPAFSGTREVFDTAVMNGDHVAAGECFESNVDVRDRVSALPGAIGYVGLPFLEGVKPLAVDGIKPTARSVVAGVYPITRSLFLVTNGYPAPASFAQQIVNMGQNPVGQEIVRECGLVPVSDYQRQSFRQVFYDYWAFFVGALALAAIALLVAIYVVRQNRMVSRILVKTDREIAERRSAERKLRAISDSTLDAIVMMDSHGDVAYWNPAAERIFGYSSREAIGQNLHDLLTPVEYRERANQGLATFIHSGQGAAIGQTLELEALRKGGAIFPIEISLSAIQMDGCWWAVATIRDITKQKALETKRSLYLSRLEHLNQLQEDLISPSAAAEKLKKISDAAVEILDLAFCRIWITRPGDLCDAGCIHAAGEGHHNCPIHDECLHLASSSGHYTHIDGDYRRVPFGFCKVGQLVNSADRKFLTNQVTVDPQVHDHRSAQELGLVSFAGYKLRDAHGKAIGVLGVYSKRPISEEDDAFLSNLAETTSRAILDGEANRTLQEAIRTSEIATQAKSCFLANMSHEIRTPMTAILGFTDILLDSVQEPGAREAAEIVKRNGEHLLIVINDILDISKIEAGKVELEIVRWSPRQVIAEIISLLHVPASAKGLTLVDEYVGPLPETIQTDPTRLRQVLLNVVGNAIKFTESGGIRVVTHLVETPGADPKISFDVIDTGIGIKESQIVELFEPFTQVDATASRRFEGTGLGLTISRRLARLLNGDITATSRPGTGSTFTVTVGTGPLDGVRLVDGTRETSSDRESAAMSPDTPRRKFQCRVLLAADVPDNQRLISAVLRKFGADVTLAENGQQAVEMAMSARPGWGKRHDDRQQSFDVILMDIQMPVLDGLQATRRLRGEGYAGPIVALTAHAMRGDRQECLDAGFDDYVTKPIDRKKLIDVVRTWTSKRQANLETGSERETASRKTVPWDPVVPLTAGSPASFPKTV